MRQQLTDAESKLAATGAKLDKSEAERRDLEKSLAPRFIWWSKDVDEPISHWRGWSVRITSIPDFEARRAAKNLRDHLHNAGWNIETGDVVVKDDLNIADGVTVFQYVDERVTTKEPILAIPSTERSREAAHAIREFIRLFDWEDVEESWSPPGELKPDEIRIEVGFKPASHFLPEPFREMNRERQDMEKKERERERQFEERRKLEEKTLEEMRKNAQPNHKP